MRWKIYYGNGESFTDQEGSPFDAPARNVQCIAQEDAEVGRVILNSRDFYLWTGEEWNGVDMFGLFDQLCRPGPQKVLFGRTLSNAEFRAVLDKAVNDDYLPPKAGRYAWERKA